MIAAIDWFRWVGPITMGAVLIGGLWAIQTHKLGKDASISLHIATTPKFYYLMGTLLTIGGALFYCFLAFWLMPFYSVHPIGYVLLVIAFIAQLGMSWVPDSSTNKKLHLAHFTFGGTVGICMILFLMLLCLSIEDLPVVSATLVVVSTVVSLTYLVLFCFVKSSYKHFLIYESIFIGLFALTNFALAFAI